MPQEPAGYRDVLERIRQEAAGELVTVAEASRISGIPVRRVTRAFTGWTNAGRDKRIPATTLARQMTN